MKQSIFLKNTLTLFTGTMLAQIIAVTSYPFLSRIYSPENFGVLASVMAIASIIIPAASLRYESAIVIEKDNDSAVNLQRLCISLLFCSSLLLLLVLFFYPDILFLNIEKKSAGTYIYYSIPILFLFGFINILFSRLNRESRYKLLGSAHIVRRLTLVFSQIIFSLFGIASIGLILGNILGAFVAILFILIFGKDIFSNLLSGDALNKEVALRYADFPKYAAPQSFVNAFSAQMPILAFATYYGAGIVGSLYLAMKIVQIPLTVMGQAVRTVFLKHAADNRENIPKIYSYLSKITLVLILLIVPPAVVLFYYGPILFEIIFGDNWREAGTFSAWLIIWFGGNFIQQPTRALFTVFEMQRTLLMIEIFLGISRFLTLVISILFYDVLTAIASFSIISLIFFTCTIIGWFIFLRNRC